jgi:hypothetical protein
VAFGSISSNRAIADAILWNANVISFVMKCRGSSSDSWEASAWVASATFAVSESIRSSFDNSLHKSEFTKVEYYVSRGVPVIWWIFQISDSETWRKFAFNIQNYCICLFFCSILQVHLIHLGISYHTANILFTFSVDTRKKHCYWDWTWKSEGEVMQAVWLWSISAVWLLWWISKDVWNQEQIHIFHN